MAKSEKVSSELRAARECRDELLIQLLLERRHALVLPAPAEGEPPEVPKAVLRALEGFEFAAKTFPELRDLESIADRVLVRADGLVFNVALLTVAGKHGPASTRLSLEELVDVGARCAGYTGSVSGNRMPVTFQLFELFPGPIPDAFMNRAAAFRRRGLQNPKVGVGVVALDCASGHTWSNFPGLVRFSHVGLARRAFRERGSSREARAARLANTGFQPAKAALGAAIGAALGSAATFGLLSAGARDGKLYGAAVVLSTLAAATISLKSCRVVHATVAQTTVAGGLSALASIGVGHALGLELGFGTLLTLGASVLVSALIGVADNPQGAR